MAQRRLGRYGWPRNSPNLRVLGGKKGYHSVEALFALGLKKGIARIVTDRSSMTSLEKWTFK
jgi:hypothetical protein